MRPSWAVVVSPLTVTALSRWAVSRYGLNDATGPINGWLPAPTDLTRIANGVDSRVESLLAVEDAAHRPGLRRLAAITASWYFGANRAGAAMYDPATGVTYDGPNADGVVN